jgi:hypothetical protein
MGSCWQAPNPITTEKVTAPTFITFCKVLFCMVGRLLVQVSALMMPKDRPIILFAIGVSGRTGVMS